MISAILTISELHPYYVNLLCDKLWDYSKKPTVSDVNHCWEEALVENSGKIIADLEPLNTNRMKVVNTIALLNAVNEPNSKLFLDKVNYPSPVHKAPLII